MKAFHGSKARLVVVGRDKTGGNLKADGATLSAAPTAPLEASHDECCHELGEDQLRHVRCRKMNTLPCQADHEQDDGGEKTNEARVNTNEQATLSKPRKAPMDRRFEKKNTARAKAVAAKRRQRLVRAFDSMLQGHRLKSLLGPTVDRINIQGRSFVGAYELLLPIGKGGYGQVWEARRLNSPTGAKDDRFAIKIMAKAEFASETKMNMLADEIGLQKIVKHKNLTSMHDVLHDKRYVYLVMELAAMDINDYEEKYADCIKCDNYIQTVLKGILSGVAYLHENGIAHMDLKTDNILIKRDEPPQKLTPDDIRICDFGLSVIGDPSGSVEHNSMRGTTGLMAPEVYMATSKTTTAYDAKQADIWSVGVILMDLLRCTPSSWMKIFEKRNWNHFDKMFQKAMSSLCVNLELVDSDVSDLLLRMLHMNPSKRLTVHKALNHRCMKKTQRRNNCFVDVFELLFISRNK